MCETYAQAFAPGSKVVEGVKQRRYFVHCGLWVSKLWARLILFKWLLGRARSFRNFHRFSSPGFICA